MHTIAELEKELAYKRNSQAFILVSQVAVQLSEPVGLFCGKCRSTGTRMQAVSVKPGTDIIKFWQGIVEIVLKAIVTVS